ncbi:MAG TPA: cytochrome P450 [Nevskiaceae bacterium]|nr:cytochrome P450 [Nevskiaceae bacterium]
MTNAAVLKWDPYDREIALNPYPVYKRLREEQPLYYNEEYDFWAVSHYADVEACFRDPATFSSGYGDILEIIKAKTKLPDGVFINQDPPIHTAFRALMQKVISPRRMSALEGQIRATCAQSLDKVVGQDRFDFITNLGAEMPMKIISGLLGIPEKDQEAVRKSTDDRIRTEAGKPIEFNIDNFSGECFDAFAEYIKWRKSNPSDDMMSELLAADFKDPTGTVRKLKDDELLAIVNVVAGAGNETTTRLIGWMGKVLAEHPEQRHQLRANPSLIPQAIEELLRFEPPGPAIARYVAKDTTIRGTKIPEGSAMMLLAAAANRDEARFVNGDTFDIHREQRPHLGFGHGIHVCIGAALARLEGRVAMEEVLKRFSDWEVDYDNAVLSNTSTVRGWDNLPVYVGSKPKTVSVPAAKPAEAAAPATAAEVTLEGTWNLVVKGPTGPQPTVLVLQKNGDAITGTQSGQGTTSTITDFKKTGNQVFWINHVTSPLKMKVEFSGELTGNTMSGKVKAGFMGKYPFTGTKA